MKKTLTYKIFESHLLEGELTAGQEVRLKVNQTLTQDTTGTMAFLQFLAMDVDKVKTDVSVAYIDHNLLQTSFENADDHAFIQSVAKKHGIIFSKPGAGICHQVHLERFAKPGAILLGSDSHTPHAGGLGSIAIGMGGLDVAIAMATGMTTLVMPKVYNIQLINKPRPSVSGKDIILKVLKELSLTGGVGFVMEYSGEGIRHLSVTERSTICNMGAELGATTSIFPSDENTLRYLTQYQRPKDYLPMTADEGATYDRTLIIDLSQLKPMVAQPHMPDNVVEINSLDSIKVDQVAIGSCTNSSYSDMMKVVNILKGKTIHPDVSLVISPGSANILRLLSENGGLSTMIQAGARILESGCGPCIGMGQAPKTNGVSVRSFNRNFKGRSGTGSAQVYLVSPETAAYTAVQGYLSDPSELEDLLKVEELDDYGDTKGYLIYPPEDGSDIEIALGPNIQPFPRGVKLENQFSKEVLLKVEDNITTDDIVPSYAKLLPYRSNIPYLSDYCFFSVDPEFPARAKEKQGGVIVAGENYGQGSSREHAALIPLYLGVKAVIAKSYARIHRNNLINAGILPLLLLEGDVKQGDELEFDDMFNHVAASDEFMIRNLSTQKSIKVKLTATTRERDILHQGGFLNYSKSIMERLNA